MKMKKIVRTILFTMIIMTVLMGGICYWAYGKSQEIQEKEQESQLRELDIFIEGQRKEVVEERNITKLDIPMKNLESNVVYQEAFSQGKTKEVDKQKKKFLYDFESPLFIWNLYGTNQLSMYMYFKSTEASLIRYTIQVEDDTIPNFTRTLYNGEQGNATRRHEYQMIGFVPGCENIILIEMLDKKGEILNKKYFSIQVPKTGSGAKTKLTVSSGRSDQLMSNGLFTVFGEKYLWLYDNSGVLRGEIPLSGATSQTVHIEGEKLYYGIDHNRIVKVGKLGQVEMVYSLGKYKQYQEFVYNGYGDLWILATKEGKQNKSVRDTVISLSLDDKKVKELFCMDELLPKMMKKASRPKGEKKLNWIDLNGITRVSSDEVLVSSKELSTMFKIVKINSRFPRISYLIAEEQIWKNTDYEKKLLNKLGQKEIDAAQQAAQENSVIDLGEAKEVFQGNFGQTWLECRSSSELTEGQYYVYVWDSNYGNSPTRKDIKWKKFDGIGTSNSDAKLSYLKKYLVDENQATYDLVENKELTYTNSQGSAYFIGEHRVDNIGNQKKYAEYDGMGRLIREFQHSIKGVQRVEKESLKNYLFY